MKTSAKFSVFTSQGKEALDNPIVEGNDLKGKDLEADKTLKTGFNMYLNLIGEPKEEDIMFENMLLTAPGDSILQVVVGLLKGAHNLNLKPDLKSEAMEKGRRPTKYRIIWDFLR